MTINELAQELRYTCENAQRDDKVTMIYLFGIKYHVQIKEVGVKQIIEQSGLPFGHASELGKAIKLGKLVQIKNQ